MKGGRLMPNLVAMMVVRNEAHRYLSACLDSLEELVDEILILDDHSTDETPEICLSYRKVRLIRKEESTFWIDESSLRSQCWQYTIALQPQWILAIDADELMEEGLKEALPELLNQKDYHRIAFRLIEFWGSKDKYRVDKLWNPRNRWVTNLIRYLPSHPYRFSPKKLHCGRLPVNLPGKILYSKFHLKHYGYANPKEHVGKFLRYTKNDPYGENCPLSHYLSILDPDPELKSWKQEKKEPQPKDQQEKIPPGLEKKKKPQVDLVIVSYNSWQDVKRCLESIRRHTPAPYHIIVVDNYSTDKTVAYLKSQSDITSIYLPHNQGYAAAVNRGLKEGEGDYIFLLNQDIIVTPGWLEPLLYSFEKNPQVAVVGPKLITPEGLIAGAGVVGTVSKHHIRGFLEPDVEGRYEEEEECLSISGACYGIRRNLLSEIGLFDESFFLYFEETDYSLRAQKKGYRVLYCPKSLVYHDMQWEKRDHKALNITFQESQSIFQNKWHPKAARMNTQQVFKKRFGVLDG